CWKLPRLTTVLSRVEPVVTTTSLQGLASEPGSLLCQSVWSTSQTWYVPGGTAPIVSTSPVASVSAVLLKLLGPVTLMVQPESPSSPGSRTPLALRSWYLCTLKVPQTGRLPAAKSNSVAVSDADERVLDTKVAKHCSGPVSVPSRSVMSTPPSKNSVGFSAPPSLSGWFHGGLMADWFVMAHATSPP